MKEEKYKVQEEMIDVLIVDDHVSMREALRGAYVSAGGFRVVGELSSAAPAPEYCSRLHPDLVLMDVCTEGGASGLKAAEEIRKNEPDIKVIIMTAFDEISYIPRAKEIGADAFIYKSRSLHYFIETSRKVMQGERCFPEPKTIPMPQGETPLTEREMEVLRLICRHMNSREIAEELFISEDTVKYHKRNMLQKTGFSRTIDLAFYMISNGWINPLY